MRYRQQVYTPINTEKYIGKDLPFSRSSWELSMMEYFDRNPAILQWSSEPFAIPYVSVDGKVHRYFPDFTVVYKTRSGDIRKELIEVKPYKQSKPSTSKNPRKRIAETVLYAQNLSKWTAAKEWADQNGYVFRVVTEKGDIRFGQAVE